MTYTLGQFVAELDRIIMRLKADMPDIAVGYASDCIANVQERIQMTGTGSDGARLRAYTIAYEKFKKNPQKTKRGRDLGLGSSRYTGKVDYTLTGRMWADIRPLSVQSNGYNIRVLMGARKKENIDKLRGLYNRDKKNPIAPSDEEIAIANENLKVTILGYFDSIK